MGLGSQPHAPATSTAWRDLVPIVQEAGWAPGPVWTGGKSRPHRDSIPDRPARRQSWSSHAFRKVLKFCVFTRGSLLEVHVLGEPPTVSTRCSLGKLRIQGDSGRKVNILGGDSIGHSERKKINPLNAELNPICHLLALLRVYPILHISRIRVNMHICLNVIGYRR